MGNIVLHIKFYSNTPSLKLTMFLDKFESFLDIPDSVSRYTRQYFLDIPNRVF